MPMAGVSLALFWAAALSFFLRESGARRFLEFLIPFFAYSLLMGVVAALSLSRSKTARFIRYMLVGFCAISAGCATILYLYYRKIRSRFSSVDVMAFLQSDSHESYNFFTEYIISQRGIILALTLIILTLFIAKLCATTITYFNINTKKYRLLTIIQFIAIIISFILLSQHNIIRTTYSTYNQYFKDIEDFHKYQSIIENQPIDAAIKKEQGELYIIVIGEATSRDFMHCYNGPAENTPWADTLREQPDWVVFENAYAFYTHTVQALGAALTDGRALTGLTFPQGQNILGISRQAGIHTTWLSNQMHFGAWDNPISALAHMADNVQFTAKAHSFQLSAPLPDSVLLPLIEQALDKADPQKNSFLAIHLMGSHSPYDRRYPENFEPVPMYEKKHLGSLAEKIRHKRYQEYLTSIKYTDEILKNIHHTVARQADRPVFLLYFADHGEDSEYAAFRRG